MPFALGRLAQSAKTAPERLIGGLPSGPAVGAMPIDAPAGKMFDWVGVEPRSSTRKAVNSPRLIWPASSDGGGLGLGWCKP